MSLHKIFHFQVPRGEGEALAGKFECAFSEVSAAEGSDDIVPVMLHLIHRASQEGLRTCDFQSSQKSRTASEGGLSNRHLNCFRCSHNEDIKSAKDHFSSNSLAASPLDSLRKIKSLKERDCQNKDPLHSTKRTHSCCRESPQSDSTIVNPYFSLPKYGMNCSQRCRSFDESLNLRKMEVFTSSPSIENQVYSKLESKFISKCMSQKKLNRPSQMPTGKSKNRKTRSNILKSLDTRLVRNCDLPPNNINLRTDLRIPRSADIRSYERSCKPLSQTSRTNMYLSRSMDHNLPICGSDSKTHKVSNNDNKGMTLLQRGRSFIKEAKDKHWRDRSLRLSFRNVSARSDSFKSDKGSLVQLSVKPKHLPTGGKTWLSRSEGDDDRSVGFLDVLKRQSSSASHSARNSTSPPTRDASPSQLNRDSTKVFYPNCPPPETRHRKFSVISRTLGHFLPQGSMPDLPHASNSFYDKLELIKKAFKKSSV